MFKTCSLKVRFAGLLLAFVSFIGVLGFQAHPAAAQVASVSAITDAVNPSSSDAATSTPPTTAAPADQPGPEGPKGPSSGAGFGDSTFNISLGNGASKPSQSITIIILITILSIAPAILLMTTSFTRIIIVLSLTRNAMGVQMIPPNQVMVGLALFLSLFIMGPTFSDMNKEAIQPYLKGQLTQSQAFEKGSQPIKKFMLKQTRQGELALFIRASGDKKPAKPSDVSMTALVPAYILSELKTAFIIGFVIFVPFLVIDLVVSSSLMSMGMMMLPPVLISLPFKLLLFVMVDGWALVVRALISSFR